MLDSAFQSVYICVRVGQPGYSCTTTIVCRILTAYGVRKAWYVQLTFQNVGGSVLFRLGAQGPFAITRAQTFPLP